MDKYLRAYAQIDLDAINSNVEQVKHTLKKGVKVMAVIKADGYGHGALPVAKSLHEIGVDAFAVAIIDEGIALRKQGIQSPILILGYTSPYQLYFDTKWRKRSRNLPFYYKKQQRFTLSWIPA